MKISKLLSAVLLVVVSGVFVMASPIDSKKEQPGVVQKIPKTALGQTQGVARPDGLGNPASPGRAPLTALPRVQRSEKIQSLRSLVGGPAYGVEFFGADFISFDLATPGSPVVKFPATASYYAGDIGQNGVYYMVDNATSTLVTIDTSTGVITTVGAMTVQSGHTWTGMSFDPTTSTMYAASTNGSTSTLYTVNTGTGATTVVGSTTVAAVIIAIAVNNYGTMFAHDIGVDAMYRLDKATAAATLIGSTTFNASYAQGMDVNPATNELFMAAYNFTTSQAELRLVDTLTGAAAFIGLIGAGTSVEVDAFAIGGSAADPVDPNPPTAVTAYSDFTTPTSILVSWTNPTTLVNGSPIGPYVIRIKRDGVQIIELAGPANTSYNDVGRTTYQQYTYTLQTRLTGNDSLSIPVEVSRIAGGSPFPSPPTLDSISTNATEARLRWTHPTTQADGTPVHSLNFSIIYRNGVMIDSVAYPGTLYTDTPPPGFLYPYYVIARNSLVPPRYSSASNTLSGFVGSAPDYLIWQPADVISSSADSISASLTRLGKSNAITDSLLSFGPLSQFDAVFACVGIYSNNHVVLSTDPEGPLLDSYVNNGGRLYLEGGDVFNYDPGSGGYNFQPVFGLTGSADGGADVTSITGQNAMSGITLNYGPPGGNNWMDELHPSSGGGSRVFFIVPGSTPANDTTSVFNDYGAGKAVAMVPEFCGLVNTVDAQGNLVGNKDSVLSKILQFFSPAGANDIGASSVDDPSSGETKQVNLAFSPKATFANVGTAVQSGIPVRFKIFDGSSTLVYTDNQTIASLAPTASQQVTFSSFTPTTTGTYTARALVLNPGDINGLNDSVTITFSVSRCISEFSPTRTTGITFTSISGTGTSFASWRAGTSIDDNRTDATAIGFTFNYMGTDYTTFSASTNGYLDLSSSTATGAGTGAYGYDNTAFTSPGGTLLALVPLYDDLIFPTGTLQTDIMKYQVDGSAPNRILTVEWIGAMHYPNSSAGNLNFQVKLYETSNKIEFLYGSMSGGTGTFDYTLGLNASSMSAPPGVCELLTQQVENSASFSNTVQNALVALPEANSKVAFEISSTTVTVGVSIDPGWNLISNPVTNPTSGDSVKQLYPTSSFNYVFAFVPGTGYEQRYVMPNGPGFWGKFPSGTTNNITGAPRTRDSISVVAGWNIVGTISNPVDTNTIVSVPSGLRASNWFGYSGGYSAVTQLVPGEGYWVKSNGAGKFVLANPPGPAKPVASGGGAMEGMSTLTISDASGGSQTLYFGVNSGQDESMFVMPPAPPEGAFDARFEPARQSGSGGSAEGGLMVKTHAEGEVEMPIAIQSAAYPLTVTWKVAGTGVYELSDGSTQRQLTGEGTLQITSSSVTRLVLKVTAGDVLPTEYALYQNYPNPFNPATNIKFALPLDSKVSLGIYNILGQRVRILLNEERKAGYHVVEWNGTGDYGQALGSGIYFLRLSAQGGNGSTFNEVRKVTLLK